MKSWALLRRLIKIGALFLRGMAVRLRTTISRQRTPLSRHLEDGRHKHLTLSRLILDSKQRERPLLRISRARAIMRPLSQILVPRHFRPRRNTPLMDRRRRKANICPAALALGRHRRRRRSTRRTDRLPVDSRRPISDLTMATLQQAQTLLLHKLALVLLRVSGS